MARENIPSTPAELVVALKALNADKNMAIPEDYRYILYARKSTDEKDNQVRSLGDQVAECKEYAQENGLRIVEIVQEAESAKEPDIRPKFRKIIEGIKASKYDGILAWHPDRLARNMKDAGEIIDLLDKEIIRDLKFRAFTFDRRGSSGKMLLGITFVLAKEYSDHLSESINRGNKRSVEEGKYIQKAKHGYYKDPNQFLRPDGDNFLLMQNAFRMRFDGKIFDEIARYLNERGYQQWQKDGTHHSFKWDFRKVESIMRDPIYTGVLWYGKHQAVNLMELYDFRPMLSVEEFMRINKFTREGLIKASKSYRRQEAIKADLMRQMIICATCGTEMTAGITPKKTAKGTTNYFYYRCDNRDYDGEDAVGKDKNKCPRCGKSVRAKVVMDYIYAFLESDPFSSKRSYEHYKAEMKTASELRLAEAKSSLASLQAQKRRMEGRLQKIKNVLASDEDNRIKATYRDDFDVVEREIIEVDANITKAETAIRAGKTGVLTYHEFLELMRKMPQILRKRPTLQERDYICRKLFLNLTLSAEKVVNAKLNEPFSALYELNIREGGGAGN